MPTEENPFYFNSTMVRLKAGCKRRAKRIKQFQFHYGTIKSSLTALLGIYLLHFNSTMVRLKGLIPLL